MPNSIVKESESAGRDYSTANDVTEALKRHDVDRVRHDLLKIIAGMDGHGCEDAGLCAFVAANARRRRKKVV